MEEKTDIRIIKTQRAIKNAFLELMEETGFSNMNVKQIIERAEINRSTFYIHYVDKFDLLNRIEEELLAGFREIGITAPVELIQSQNMDLQEADVQKIEAYSTRLANYISENGKLFTLLISDKGDPAFASKFGEMLKTIWEEKEMSDRVFIPQNYAIAALTGIMTNLIAEWVKSDYRETPEEFARIVSKIIRNVPKNLFE
ncbi:hypothetical protein MmiAt1_13710 [Methanimicrococcus sp. At1]|uniref:HTH tetR-type domain-containing protein n=1 Tax=Methanimicrococcus hacksteinii TaxID=3028293 RepID=A0ABU3VR37_9EURY|nr:TetR/AcrR family transcriptional regulator [Methanimicrococcus sp. At1]MDV0445775.1 hypothetical protein [Methanimicrococcus sp. At1]